MISDAIEVMRPKQWYKNLIIFVAIIFSFNLTRLDLYAPVILAFFLFCALSSGIYVMNDVVDKERDKKHPKKRHRPIAAGRVSEAQARVLSAFLVSVFFSSLAAFL